MQVYIYPYGECEIIKKSDACKPSSGLYYESTEEVLLQGVERYADVYCDVENNCFAVLD